jgi:hypothetical protein
MPLTTSRAVPDGQAQPGRHKGAHLRVAIDLLTEGATSPSRAQLWTRVIQEMAVRLGPGEELHLLRAWAAGKHELGDRQLAVVGGGRDHKHIADLKALGVELGIANDVVFVGPVPLEETSSSTGAPTPSVTRPSARRSACQYWRRWPAVAR